MNGASDYERRAASYAAEIAEVVAPRLLNGLLHTGMTVAEAPSGTGHFLSYYAAVRAEVVLIDLSPAMLAAARPAVRGQKLRTVCCRIEDLDPTWTGLADLVVVANAALNQLAAGLGPAAVLAAAARILAPGGLLLAQVLLADGDNADLLRAAAAGRSQLRVTTAAQLNGVPHFGTVVTILTVFAFTAHAAEVLNLPSTIVFDSLENAPAEHLQIDGQTYTRTVGDLIEVGRLDGAERVSGVERLLTWARKHSGISYEFRPYDVYQGLRPVRECLHHIASHLEQFAPIVAPRDGIVRVRPRCPDCRLMQKSARDLRITALSGAIRLDSRCPEHGPYSEIVHIDGGGWYDANTPVRSIQKGALLSAERQIYDACSVSVDGADWGGAWHAHVLAPALATLGIPPRDWPVSVFTPLIVDRTGGKLSKTLYVTQGAYNDLPPLFLDLNVLLDSYGEDILHIVWAEVTRWATEPRRLHRSYTVDYLRALLETPQPRTT